MFGEDLDEDKALQTSIFFNCVQNLQKKRNKIKRHSITCSYIWYFDI